VKNYTYTLILICLLFTISTIKAQPDKVSSYSTKQIDSLSEIAKKDLIGNIDRLRHIIKISQDVKYSKGELQGLIHLGVIAPIMFMITPKKL